MNARSKNYELLYRLDRAGIDLDFDQVNTLRRASMTLSRWAELECGDGNQWASCGIERDETTEKPYMVTHHNNGTTHRRLIADREKGALKRVSDLCTKAGIYFYHQTDPRGCAIYVSNEPIPSNNYTQGVAIC